MTRQSSVESDAPLRHYASREVVLVARTALAGHKVARESLEKTAIALVVPLHATARGNTSAQELVG